MNKTIKKIFSLFILTAASIFLVSCKKDGNESEKLIKEAMENIKVETILAENESVDKITNNLNFPESYEDVIIEWVSDNKDVISNSGKVTRQKEDLTVKVTASFKFDRDKKEKVFEFTVLKEEEIIETGLTHNFDFTTLTEETGYVKEEKSRSVVNLVDDTTLSFTRINSQISGSNDQPLNTGFILNLREKNGYETAYLKTDEKIESLKRINITIGTWGSDFYHQASFAEAINVEVSENGTDWIVVKDLKPDMSDEKNAVNNFILDVDNPENKDLFVKINLKSAGIPEDVAAHYQLRVIVSKLKFYNE